MTLSEFFGSTQTKLHHFYIVEGTNQDSIPELVLQLQNQETKSHIRQFSYSTIGVEEAQALRQAHTELPPEGGDQFFVVFAISVTHEAQQAMLKMFEGPRANTHFFLLMPETTSILPTVRSRAQYVRLTSSILPYQSEAQSFVKSSKDERIAFIADFVKSHEDDESSGELRLHASQFIAALVQVLHKDPKNLLSRKNFLNDALTMRGYLDSRGASVKMILEHLAITL